MRKVIILLVSLVLAGCVNPYAYRENQDVQASFSTKKGVEDTQQCILAGWQRQPLLMQITQQQIGKYHSVVSTTDNADVFSDNGLTRINYYSLRGSLDAMDGKSKRIAIIESCL
jgi:PBP1b-binding outer membrane lipoprotein LpoB